MLPCHIQYAGQVGSVGRKLREDRRERGKGETTHGKKLKVVAQDRRRVSIGAKVLGEEFFIGGIVENVRDSSVGEKIHLADGRLDLGSLSAVT